MSKLKKFYIIIGFLIVIILAVIEFGFISSKKNTKQISMSLTPTVAPKNFSASGSIANQEPRKGEIKGWWEFVADNSGSGLKLVFTPSSKCMIQAKQFICAESMLLDGEKVTITGNQNGDSLFVYNLLKID